MSRTRSIQVQGIPHTKTGKKLEVPIKRLIQGSDYAVVVDPAVVDDESLMEEFRAIAVDRLALVRSAMAVQAASGKRAMTPFRFDDVTALVTGGARGMGAAEVAALHAAGAHVLVADVLEEEGARRRSRPGRAGRVRAPRRDQRPGMGERGPDAEGVGRRFGPWSTTQECTTPPRSSTRPPTRPCWVWQVNTLGPLLGMQHVIPEMRASGGGSIVNISSAAAGRAGLLRGVRRVQVGSARAEPHRGGRARARGDPGETVCCPVSSTHRCGSRPAPPRTAPPSQGRWARPPPAGARRSARRRGRGGPLPAIGLQPLRDRCRGGRRWWSDRGDPGPGRDAVTPDARPAGPGCVPGPVPRRRPQRLGPVGQALADEVFLDYSTSRGAEPALVSRAEVLLGWLRFAPGFDATHHQVVVVRSQAIGEDVPHRGQRDRDPPAPGPRAPGLSGRSRAATTRGYARPLGPGPSPR